MSSVVERFLKYVTIDTQSKEDADCFPSTEKQKDLAYLLADELRKIGAQDVRMDETFGYVYAALPANLPEGTDAPALGFIAHMDTSPAVSGYQVKPRIIDNYDGSDIVLNREKGIVLPAAQSPELARHIGQHLIVTDGTTLLGADDKAGIAEIMAMAEYFLTHPKELHPSIRIAFTPDEEVGRGVDHFDVEGFGAAYAYTVDGGALGELEYENFNAAGAVLTVNGFSIHPGSAKGRMRNAILMAAEFQAMLPVHANPVSTERYEGFFHPDTMTGSVEQAVVHYIIRDHDREKFEQMKKLFSACADFLNFKYGAGSFEVEMRDSYYNMKDQILPQNAHLIENAVKAMEHLGIKPEISPIRGGTDGARLSFMGLPCPNLGTGGMNCHGRFEYAVAESMEDCVRLLVEIARLYAKKAIKEKDTNR